MLLLGYVLVTKPKPFTIIVINQSCHQLASVKVTYPRGLVGQPFLEIKKLYKIFVYNTILKKIIICMLQLDHIPRDVIPPYPLHEMLDTPLLSN